MGCAHQGQVLSSDEPQPGRKGLEEDRDQVGQHDHPHLLIIITIIIIIIIIISSSSSSSSPWDRSQFSRVVPEGSRLCCWADKGGGSEGERKRVWGWGIITSS